MENQQFRVHNPASQGAPTHSTPTTRPVRSFHRWSTEPDSKRLSPTADTQQRAHVRPDMGDSPSTEQAQSAQSTKDKQETPSSLSRSNWLPSSPLSPFGKDYSPASPTSAGRESISFPFGRKTPFESPVEDRTPSGQRHGISSSRNQPIDRSPASTYNVNSNARQPRTSAAIQEVPAKASKRSTLHLLNPVNLLMRRRSGVPQEWLNESANNKGLTVPPMNLPRDYDPRIRGKVVHDFSAPRPRRSVSHQEISSTHEHDISQVNTRQDDQPVRDNRQHKAVFREHLHDEPDSGHNASAIRAESLANQDFLKRVNENYPDEHDGKQPTVPRSPYKDFQQFRKSIGDWQARVSTPSPTSSESDKSPLVDLQPDQSRIHFNSPIEQAAKQESATTTATKGETAEVSQTPPETARQPDTSATNGLPKHAKSNASRFSFQLSALDNAVEDELVEARCRRKADATADADPQYTFDEEDDYFDEDAMYDADELEGLDAQSDSSEHLEQVYKSQSINDLPRESGRDDPLSSKAKAAQEVAGITSKLGLEHNNPTSNTFDDPDEGFYFNDGTIDASDAHFAGPEPNEDELFDSGNEGEGSPEAASRNNVPKDLATDSNATQFASEILRAQGVLARAQSMLASRNLLPSAPEGLEQYHNALAEAAQQAAVDGKFSRTSSSATTRSEPSRLADEETRQKILQGKGHDLRTIYAGYDTNHDFISQASLGMPTLHLTDDYNPGEDDMSMGDEFDDLINDDAIISEANAEALASDDDGFYGREFGFYARSRRNSDEERINGGFFGTPGGPTLERHHSVKEPNLTPITEHSEFSARNSIMAGPSLQLASLTLAQLQDSDDATLDQLLRGHRFPHSSASGSASSGSLPGPGLVHRRSWTAAGAPPRIATGPFLSPSPMTDSPVSARPMWEAEMDATPRNKPKGHGRSASGDSVAYLKERDEEGRERWILERRRTSEAGLVELVGREVVQGGI